MKVGLSFAHSPTSPGACFEGSCEHTFSRMWTKKLIMVLATRGIEYFVTNGKSLKYEKVPEINAANCDIAMEIHFNACGGCGASGCETLYHPDSYKGLAYAEVIQQALCKAVGNKYRGVKEGWFEMDRPGVVDFYGDEDGDEKPDYFLRATNCPALILEPEFIEHTDVITGKLSAGVMAIADAIEEIANEQEALVED